MTDDRTGSITHPPPTGRANPKATAVAGGMIVIGAVLIVIALASDAGQRRLAFAWLWGFAFCWSVVLGCLFFVALQHVSHSIWSVIVRRVAEMLASPMWLVAVLFIPMVFLLFSDPLSLYPWTDRAFVEQDHVLDGKQPYLNPPFFLVRAGLFFALWIGFATYYVRTSLRQDVGRGGESASANMRKWSAPFMLIFAVTVTFAGIDWLMSLDPYWYSTIFGVYVFAGLVVTALAAIILVTVLLRDTGRLPADMVTDQHLYTLGALLFAFACFWAYIAFSQYMLIWYANLPEESFYMVERLKGGWLGVSIALGVTRFVVPFGVLLSRRAKSNPRILLWISVLMLLGQMLDLYWLIMPEQYEHGPVLSAQELGPMLLMIGLLVGYASRFLGRNAAVPVGDPLLERSVHIRA